MNSREMVGDPLPTIGEIRAYNLKEKEAKRERQLKRNERHRDYGRKHPDRIKGSQWRSLIRRMLNERWVTHEELRERLIGLELRPTSRALTLEERKARADGGSWREPRRYVPSIWDSLSRVRLREGWSTRDELLEELDAVVSGWEVG